MKCNTCNNDIVKIAVLSPDIDKKKRVMCIECAKKSVLRGNKMIDYEEWLTKNELDVWDDFRKSHLDKIKSEYNMKFKESYPDFDDFLEQEETYIKDTMLNNEWVKFLEEQYISEESSQIDSTYDKIKDESILQK